MRSKCNIQICRWLQPIIFVCFLLTVGQYGGSEELVLGSWNIQGNGGPFNEQELVQFGSYFVRDKNIDILALQEVKVPLKKLHHTTVYKTRIGNDFLDHFEQALERQTGGVWKFVSSCDYAIRENIDEYVYCNAGLDNAVLYRADKLVVEELHAGYPFYFDNFHKSPYKMNMNNTNVLKVSDRFANKSFYLINKHMPYTSKRKGWQPWYRDIAVLQQLYNALENAEPKILCGDFNAAHHSFYTENGTSLFTDCFIGCRKPTTINRQLRYAHEYDHFILNAAATELVIQEPNRYTSDADSSGSIRYGTKSMTLEYFIKHLSDHVPIFMSFDF
ncbi:MAG: endonuclease/exonuclease/phosphatase family protein [Treponema sp.]